MPFQNKVKRRFKIGGLTMKLYKSGELVERGGKFVEVGCGGGKIKEKYRQTVEIKDQESLPLLKSYDVTTQNKGEKKTKTRQHKWLRV